MAIQLDMFAVELGAALLLQFRTTKGNIRVLADAGHAKYRVVDKLRGAISEFASDGKLQIDLLIGTHYDSDHLDGLVDIINDSAFDIGEAWLPPVADDTRPHSAQQMPDESDLLAFKFKREGAVALNRYLDAKAKLCNSLVAFERQAIEVGHPQADIELTELNRTTVNSSEDERYTRKFFELHVSDAEQKIGRGPIGHEDQRIADIYEIDDIDAREMVLENYPGDFKALSYSWQHGRAERALIESRSMAYLRKATAEDAISAISLAAVVEALSRRKIAFRSSTIKDGEPREFFWEPHSRRFTPVRNGDVSEPKLTLLGPSDGLVKKHWDKLPEVLFTHLAARSALPIEPITPSNQLSYIMVFEESGQRILVAGDAGCVDFKPGRNKPYYKELLDSFTLLHVVQVAHHAGQNAHFYNCLLESRYPSQEPCSYLLLSHKTKDEKRPSDLFSKFVERLRRSADQLQLLFTSLPLETKVRDVKGLIGKVIGGPPKNSGDIQIQFSGEKWSVTKHSVDVRP